MKTDDKSKGPVARAPAKGEFWWANAIFFVGTHLAACVGAYYRPVWAVPRQTLILGIVIWQLSCFAVTIGYHRMYSHQAFRAAFGVRVILAMFGSMAFQGSIKWWCLRHRLHHRFTDDPINDPYAATRGLFFSHVGWIFYKPKYEKMETIDKADLDSDAVVRFQHRYYVPLALISGFVLPTILGMLWGDPSGAYVWAGLVSRIAIWHCTFLVNSLAHWDGLQPYSDENTSRGSLIMALLTCGEGNHNFHSFPHDFRSGPSLLSWDPSKWIILMLHRVGLASGLRRARKEDIKSAEEWMRLHGHEHPSHPMLSLWESSYETSDESVAGLSSQYSSTSASEIEEEEEWDRPVWGEEALGGYVGAKPGRCVVLLDGYAVDVTRYLGEHPGGALLLRQYSFRGPEENLKSGSEKLERGEEPEMGIGKRAREASAAFHGGMNKHSRAARRRMRQLRVARVVFSNL